MVSLIQPILYYRKQDSELKFETAVLLQFWAGKDSLSSLHIHRCSTVPPS
jgi:hypothetical protein